MMSGITERLPEIIRLVEESEKHFRFIKYFFVPQNSDQTRIN